MTPRAPETTQINSKSCVGKDSKSDAMPGSFRVRARTLSGVKRHLTGRKREGLWGDRQGFSVAEF